MTLLLVHPAISTELPLPVVRWLEAAWPDGPEEIETLALRGPVRIRRNRLWLPGHADMRFELGVGYVSDIRLGFGPLTAVHGLDAFVDGCGITRVGSATAVGSEIDQGAFLALWCESLLFPTAWARLPGLRWIFGDETEARVELPFRGGLEAATIRFDPESPFPVAFEADRHRAIGSPKVAWRAEYGIWHWREGLALPTRMQVTWADEPGPWFEMRLEEVVPNEPITEPFDRARRVIAEARTGTR